MLVILYKCTLKLSHRSSVDSTLLYTEAPDSSYSFKR